MFASFILAGQIVADAPKVSRLPHVLKQNGVTASVVIKSNDQEAIQTAYLKVVGSGRERRVKIATTEGYLRRPLLLRAPQGGYVCFIMDNRTQVAFRISKALKVMRMKTEFSHDDSWMMCGETQAVFHWTWGDRDATTEPSTWLLYNSMTNVWTRLRKK